MTDLPVDALILAAGLGTRMRPLTDARPKALVTVAGRTLLDRAIDHLTIAGVRHVVVNVHHHAEQVIAHLDARAGDGITFEISDERDGLLETGGALVRAAPLMGGRSFFVLNVDAMWCDGMQPTLVRLASRWDPDAMDALLLAVPTVVATGYDGVGDFAMDPTGRLFRRPEQEVAPFVYGGVQIVHPRLLDGAPDGAFSTNRLWDRAIVAERLFGLRHEGPWMHVGTPDAVVEAERALAELA